MLGDSHDWTGMHFAKRGRTMRRFTSSILVVTTLFAAACTDSGSGESDDVEQPGPESEGDGNESTPGGGGGGGGGSDSGTEPSAATPECIAAADLAGAGASTLGVSGGVLCDIPADLGLVVTVQYREANATTYQDLAAWTWQTSGTDILEMAQDTGCFPFGTKLYRTVVTAYVNGHALETVTSAESTCPMD